MYVCDLDSFASAGFNALPLQPQVAMVPPPMMHRKQSSGLMGAFLNAIYFHRGGVFAINPGQHGSRMEGRNAFCTSAGINWESRSSNSNHTRRSTGPEREGAKR